MAGNLQGWNAIFSMYNSNSTVHVSMPAYSAMVQQESVGNKHYVTDMWP